MIMSDLQKIYIHDQFWTMLGVYHLLKHHRQLIDQEHSASEKLQRVDENHTLKERGEKSRNCNY